MTLTDGSMVMYRWQSSGCINDRVAQCSALRYKGVVGTEYRGLYSGWGLMSWLNDDSLSVWFSLCPSDSDALLWCWWFSLIIPGELLRCGIVQTGNDTYYRYSHTHRHTHTQTHRHTLVAVMYIYTCTDVQRLFVYGLYM